MELTQELPPAILVHAALVGRKLADAAQPALFEI